MGIACELEHFIREFVRSYHNIVVCLNLGPPIQVHHVTETGSTVLGLFWSNILQASVNFPITDYFYEHIKDHQGRSNFLKLNLPQDSVIITVCMRTGQLTVEGSTSHEWFSKKFRGILERYESVPGEVACHSRYQDPGYTRADNPEAHLLEKEAKKLEKRANSGLAGVERTPDLSASFKCEDLLEVARNGTLLPGTSVYEMVLHMTEKWLRSGSAIYLSSPQLDIGRLRDFADLVIDNGITGKIDALFVQYKCAESFNGLNIKREVLKHYPDSTDKLLIEYKLLDRMCYPASNFQATFVAGVDADHAVVLVLGGPLTSPNVRRDSPMFVSLHHLIREDFLAKYIEPLQAAVL